MGLGLLRLPPDQFWKLTPREIAFLAGGARPVGNVPARRDLDALMARFPDA